jgi:DNA-binding FrmR family transcriptional regulator
MMNELKNEQNKEQNREQKNEVNEQDSQLKGNQNINQNKNQNNNQNKNQNADKKIEILKRLRRIEGQVKGIQHMIEEDKSCKDILTQVAAVRAAVNKTGALIMQNHSIQCIKDAVVSGDENKAMEKLLKTMNTFMRFIE